MVIFRFIANPLSAARLGLHIAKRTSTVERLQEGSPQEIIPPSGADTSFLATVGVGGMIFECSIETVKWERDVEVGVLDGMAILDRHSVSATLTLGSSSPLLGKGEEGGFPLSLAHSLRSS